ncbi:MAG: hypothetical protein JWO05_617 [Gemmatimonadetes bacterium]|nr:hypothetical protein [Gemmatimonadota bacterium]
MANPGEVLGVVSVVGIIGWTIRGIVDSVLHRGDARKGSAALPHLDDDRLARIERAVDAIAVEVERVSEAQRFTAKVLTERADPQRALHRLPENPT